MNENNLVLREKFWYVELGHCDGNGMGLWSSTKESYPVDNKKSALELQEEFLRAGKLVLTTWGEVRPAYAYGLFRIRHEEKEVSLEDYLRMKCKCLN